MIDYNNQEKWLPEILKVQTGDEFFFFFFSTFSKQLLCHKNMGTGDAARCSCFVSLMTSGCSKIQNGSTEDMTNW